jgi:Ca2+/Na+ antiporter
MDFKNIFTYQNLFQINSAFISPAEKLFFMAGAIGFLIAIILKIASVMAISPVDKEYRNSFYKVFSFFGLGQMFWYVLRSQNITFFGSKFIAFLIILVSIIWFVWVVVKFIKNYSVQKDTWEKEQQKQKYLPK